MAADDRDRSLRILRILLVALVTFLIAAIVVWIATGGEDEAPAPAPQAGAPRIVSEEELVEIAAAAGQPVYWTGEMDGTEIEVTEDETGVLVRYLQEGEEEGAALAQRIAVGSYALPNPRKALNTFAETPGATVTNLDGIGKVVISPEAGKNVYFVDPTGEVQVEVFAPSAERAIGLVRSGRVRPVG